MTDDRPNVLLFTTDQQRGDHIELARQTPVETPNVAAFLHHGAYFPNAYTEIPSTTGARRCLHAGQSSYDCGLIGYAGAPWEEKSTLAQVLSDHGYHCINVGWRNMHPRRKLFGFHNVICHDLRGDPAAGDWLVRDWRWRQAYVRTFCCRRKRRFPVHERVRGERILARLVHLVCISRRGVFRYSLFSLHPSPRWPFLAFPRCPEGRV